MNFQELMQKMSELDTPVQEQDTGDVDESCGLSPSSMTDMPGGMMGMRSESPPQPDSINANVSLNASGKGGIKDLMDILRNIEGSSGDEMPGFGDDNIVVKKLSAPMGLDDDFDNAPDEVYQGVDAVTRTGGDLHSKGIEKPAVAGGGNPMAVESLKEKLQAHYNKIKEG